MAKIAQLIDDQLIIRIDSLKSRLQILGTSTSSITMMLCKMLGRLRNKYLMSKYNMNKCILYIAVYLLKILMFVCSFIAHLLRQK